MMTPSAFQQWCRTLAPSTCDFLSTIRATQPVRRVTSRANNVSGMHPSSKMGVTIQFESHKVELWAVLVMDHDSDVLEFFDQPHTFKLRYLAKSGKKMQGHYYTPDFLVLRKKSVCFEEWKTEADLKRLAALYPSLYQQMEGGSCWRCPPAEACVEPLGLTFRVRSSGELNSTYIDNLSFLADYFGAALSVPVQVQTSLLQRVHEVPGIPLAALVHDGSGVRPNDVYAMLAIEQLYADLYAAPLIQHGRVRLYLSAEQARLCPSIKRPHPGCKTGSPLQACGCVAPSKIGRLSLIEPHEISHLSIEEKKAQFREARIMHRLLEQTHRKLLWAVHEPAGFAFLLVHGPIGVGKSKMIGTIAGQIKEMALSLPNPSFSSHLSPPMFPAIPVLVIEADPPDRSAFNRGYYCRTAFTLMGEQTYQQHVHVDIHAGQKPAKRRPLRGKAAESNDLPELREATKEAMHRRGVRGVFLDEAHNMLYAGNGMQGSTLQEQLEWLKSLSNTTQVLHILVDTYDLLNFGQLNGQISRCCLPLHFLRYQLQREEDCLEFQAALLALLERVPLHCDAETLVGSYWVYFYEGCIGCIGALKDWLLRAVSTALHEGQDTLTLDCLQQDHAPPTDIFRQRALDAYEGEQKLEHTESNREHLWRLLQGGELIAPVPPRGTPPTPSPLPVESLMSRKDARTPPSLSPISEDAAPAAPLVKKTRSRKKVEVRPPEQEQGSVIQAGSGAGSAPAPSPPKRRRKKTETPVVEDPEPCVTVPSRDSGEASLGLIGPGDAVSPTKPKQCRRVGNQSLNDLLSVNRRKSIMYEVRMDMIHQQWTRGS